MVTSDLDQFSKDLLKMADEQLPRESRKFLQKEAEKLKKKTLNKVQSLKDDKIYDCYKDMKTSNVYNDGGRNNSSIEVYVDSEEAYSIENGYRQVSEDGSESSFIEGKHIFEKTKNEFQSEFENDCEEFLSDTILGGLST